MANDNPLGYKCSWSSAGVLVAMIGPAVHREAGEKVELPPGGPFGAVKPAHVEPVGDLEFHPNRDSLGYVEAYGLEQIETMFRGTFFLEKLSHAPGERDMLLMRRDFVAAYPGGRKEKITSTMLDVGVPGGDTSMARTVSLPAAIGVRLILEHRVLVRGVMRPVVPEPYVPILEDLATLGISLTETFEPL